LDVKIICRKENYENYRQMLERAGFSIVPEADLVLSEQDRSADAFLGETDGRLELVGYDRIVSIESFGHTIVLRTLHQEFLLREKLFEAENLLRDRGFLRIGKSTIIAKAGIRHIRPSLNGRFDLMMKNGQVLVVAKTYAKAFRAFIGF